PSQHLCTHFLSSYTSPTVISPLTCPCKETCGFSTPGCRLLPLDNSAFLAAGDSTVSKHPIDFDLILENLKDLNVLAGEGVSQIERTAGGARLRQPQSIALTFYQNGIVMFNGPFRSYEEPSTQQCLQDIMDGYFPSELQTRYPDGVPFQVTDRRDVFFRERQLPENFPGQGQVVGHSRSSEVKETSEIPGPKLSLEQFLNKLPKSLIREGQVIDIRGPIKETLNEVILVEMPSLAAMKERLKADEQDQPPAPNISTLRIKSENGEQTYIVKMLFTETIGDLRRHLQVQDHSPYEIISTFPQRVYADNFMTLQECGLIPNASLLLREKIPLTPHPFVEFQSPGSSPSLNVYTAIFSQSA
uniref:UBX domain-containing protein 11 n=1 Tax=Terrapene triunguis TaxID=2587831 RepID=A0A674J7I1_9SAUR